MEAFGMDEWDWELFPNGERFLVQQLDLFLNNHHLAKSLATKIEQETSTGLFDWVDNISISQKSTNELALRKMGYRKTNDYFFDNGLVFRNERSRLFPILLAEDNLTTLSLKTEELEDFQKLCSSTGTIQGKRNSCLRSAEIGREGTFVLKAVERKGTGNFTVDDMNDIDEYMKVLSIFETRKRAYESDQKGMGELSHLAESTADLLEPPRLTDAFFRAERSFWEKRNTAGQVQKRRQDDFGLGWANNDHHTFRSSRNAFVSLIRVLELIGMKPREKFYAGEQAGWGAQIMEEPATNIVAFADVDLGEGETKIDFARKGLSEKSELGTVGLWVALHGESILQAGLHHLAASFRFDVLRDDLQKLGVQMMKPFSNFTFLKQAFTQGELWKTDVQRTLTLEEQNRLTSEQRSRFVETGALGSHLENIQRGSGFKGFNQTSVSAIIRETDPRKLTSRYA
jgi:hypothetical protein